MSNDSFLTIGRNPVTEALKNSAPLEMIYVLDGCHDGPIETIKRLAKKEGIKIRYVTEADLSNLCDGGKHQGVVAKGVARNYASVEDILENARAMGEDPFIVLLDGVEDPHNLGAVIRSAHQAGAHGVIIRENRAVGLTAATARASAGAIEYMPVAKVTNMVNCIETLKKEGLWFVCAAADGTTMYDLDLKGPVGLVLGSEGSGVSRLVREHSDLLAAIPMKGRIDSLNVSVAAGVLCYEVVRQRMQGKV